MSRHLSIKYNGFQSIHQTRTDQIKTEQNGTEQNKTEHGDKYGMETWIRRIFRDVLVMHYNATVGVLNIYSTSADGCTSTAYQEYLYMLRDDVSLFRLDVYTKSIKIGIDLHTLVQREE